MLETAVAAVFCAALFASVAVRWSIIPALLLGLVLFMGYGLIRGASLHRMLMRAGASVRAAGTIVVTFVLIGVLTSLWRASGTIAFIVTHTVSVIHASTVVPLAFLLCAGMSTLIGSSFASAATMGTICMALGLSMQASPVMLGGAVLAGVYVGDRCSPVSTSALLVKQLTHTNLFDNIGRMLRTGAVPFAASCLIYAVVAWIGAPNSVGNAVGDAAGSTGEAGGAGAPVVADGTGAVVAGASDAAGSSDIGSLFAAAFHMHWTVLIPALLVIVMAVARVDVRLTMIVSIIASAAVCMIVQGMGASDLLRVVVFGYRSVDAGVGKLLDGGGILSMITVMVIVCVSSAYAGVFAETNMLGGLQHIIVRLGSRFGAYGATLLTSIVTAALACNQTLTIMLANQLCGELYTERDSHEERRGGAAGSRAIDLEDSAVVVSPLIPWSIAGAVPLATIGAPASAIAAATFLYLLPACRLVASLRSARRCDASHRP